MPVKIQHMDILSNTGEGKVGCFLLNHLLLTHGQGFILTWTLEFQLNTRKQSISMLSTKTCKWLCRRKWPVLMSLFKSSPEYSFSWMPAPYWTQKHLSYPDGCRLIFVWKGLWEDLAELSHLSAHRNKRPTRATFNTIFSSGSLSWCLHPANLLFTYVMLKTDFHSNLNHFQRTVCDFHWWLGWSTLFIPEWIAE